MRTFTLVLIKAWDKHVNIVALNKDDATIVADKLYGKDCWKFLADTIGKKRKMICRSQMKENGD